MKTVRVAAGIVQRGNGTEEVLAVQRGYGAMAGLWEFPGGKVEHGETGAEACVRELAEELQVRIDAVRSFYTIEYDYPDFHLSMECFFCRIADGTGEPVQHDRQRDMRWVKCHDLPQLDWMPADVELVRLLAAEDRAPDVPEAGADSGMNAEPDMGAEAEAAAATAKATAGASAAKRSAKGGAKANAATGRKRKKKAPRKKSLLDGIDTSDLTAQETELVRRRAAIRKSMQGNKHANTRPEMLVRQRLRAAGLTGYRLQWKKAPGRPDIAFPGRKIAVFVNGCFWHRCPHCHPGMPKRNVEFWEAKFARNVARDQKALADLHELGWTAITIWECELKRDRIDATMERVIKMIQLGTVPN